MLESEFQEEASKGAVDINSRIDRLNVFGRPYISERYSQVLQDINRIGEQTSQGGAAESSEIVNFEIEI